VWPPFLTPLDVGEGGLCFGAIWYLYPICLYVFKHMYIGWRLNQCFLACYGTVYECCFWHFRSVHVQTVQKSQCETMMSREAVTRIGSWSINGWDFRLTIWQVSVYTSIERWTYLFLSFCVSWWRRLCAALRLHLLWFCFHFLQRDLQDASESCVFPLPGKDDNPWFTLNHWRISSQRPYDSESCTSNLYPPVCLCRLIILWIYSQMP